jgi:hypothetical protein
MKFIGKLSITSKLIWSWIMIFGVRGCIRCEMKYRGVTTRIDISIFMGNKATISWSKFIFKGSVLVDMCGGTFLIQEEVLPALYVEAA